MKYEIGQKVETPLGKGNIFDVSTSGDMYHVELKDGSTKWFWENYLKPYKTPHKKLLEMGLHLKTTKNWAGNVFSHEWWSANDDRVVVFFLDEKQTTVYEGSNEIMRIIPDYLEWLEEEK